MADLRTCANGHYYDPDLYPRCPYCEGLSGTVNRSIPVENYHNGGSDTAPLNGGSVFSELGATVPAKESDDAKTVRPITNTTPKGEDGGVTHNPANTTFPQDTGVTMPFTPVSNSKTEDSGSGRDDSAPENRYSFVTGWLVAISGPYKGRSFEIHHNTTTIGRNSGDVQLPLERTVSNDHAEIQFDARHCRFYLVARLGAKNNIYVDDTFVINGSNTELKPYSEIEFGESTYRFVPFCSDNFKW